MSLSELLYLIKWDLRVNRGASFDTIRSRLLLMEIRIEQYVYCNTHDDKGRLVIFWLVCRFVGSIFQWFLCNSNIPGTIAIGRGLRLPHPQNIILAGFADIGEFCTIYHNVSIAWNGFKLTVPSSPKIGDQVLIGAGAIIIGDVTIGSDVLVGAGTVISQSVPDHSRVTNARPTVLPREPTGAAADPGSERHLRDPYSIWR